MDINFTLNGKDCVIKAKAGDKVHNLLRKQGINSVRNSDDSFGFAGSDTILLDGIAVNASLLIAAQLEGRELITAESLNVYGQLTAIQSALIDAGAIQSGYNDPAVALLLTDLLQRIPKASRADVSDTLSGIFLRESAYEQVFFAVDIAKERLQNPSYVTTVAPEFNKTLGRDLRHVGKVSRKVDAAQALKAEAVFVEDFVSENTCHLKVLRSPYAHAYIKSLNTDEAEHLEGVVAVLSYKNCPDVYYTPGGQTAPEPSPLDRKMFGQKMRHYGDRVAAVVAESEEIAQRALKLIQVEFDVLKPVMSIDEARAENAPIIHQGVISYGAGAPQDLEQQNASADLRDGKIHFNFPFGANPRKNIAASSDGSVGDINKGFAEADFIIERQYESKQVQHCPPEPHICLSYMEGDRLVIRASTQVPWHLRRHVARILGVKQNKVHVIKARVGGGFGSKQDMVVEEVCSYATYLTGRPVYFRHTREEEFTSSSSRHVAQIDIKLGAKSDGTLTALDINYLFNTGPYGNHALTVPGNAPAMSLPLVRCPNVNFDITTYYSNIVPTGAYQGYGAPKGNFALQMILAEAAEQLGIDSLDMLRINRVHEGDELPILATVGEGSEEGNVPVAESCALGEILERGADSLGWNSPKEEYPDNPHIKIGRGVATMMQKSGINGLDQANATVKLTSDGTLIAHSGGADIGTGLDTAVTKLVAEVMCTNLDDVHVISGDTDHCLFDKGAYASSGTCFSGNAAKLAAEDLKEQVLETAAKLLKESITDIELIHPGTVKGKSGEISLTEIAQYAESGTGCGMLQGKGCFTTSETSFPFGANFVEVGVDTQTGEIDLRKFHALLDCGTPINPELALGQVYGASIRAIGHSLSECIKYNKEGQVINANLADYGVQNVGDLPKDFRAELVVSDDSIGPYGGKSISEIGVNAAAPAIASAIHDATGVWIREWNITPEKILKALGTI